jgi:hypothetical protein
MQSENLPTGVPKAVKFMLGLSTQTTELVGVGGLEVVGFVVSFLQENKALVRASAKISCFIVK